MTKEEKLKEQIIILKNELKKYEKAYYTLIPYFDSISDEEQDIVAKKLTKIFKIKTTPKK